MSKYADTLVNFLEIGILIYLLITQCTLEPSNCLFDQLAEYRNILLDLQTALSI